MHRQRIFILRHGESEANARGIIVSSPENGITAYGITASGREQVARSVKTLQGLLPEVAELVIAHSPFLRTKETAQIVFQCFPKAVLLADLRLRERNFGELELTPTANYSRIWDIDTVGEVKSIAGVESLETVAARMRSALEDLQSNYRTASVLIVSHGDPLQILQTALSNRPLSQHRELQHIRPGELREITNV